jgi:hypothetical protein
MERNPWRASALDKKGGPQKSNAVPTSGFGPQGNSFCIHFEPLESTRKAQNVFALPALRFAFCLTGKSKGALAGFPGMRTSTWGCKMAWWRQYNDCASSN